MNCNRRPRSTASLRGRVLRFAGINTVTTIGSALLSAVGVIIVAHQGRNAEIGSYTAGSVGAAIVGVALSFGTTLRQVVGTGDERATLKTWRLCAVFPALILVGVVLSSGFGRRDYSQSQVLLAAWAVAINNLVDLHLASLQRQLRYVPIALSSLLPKAGATVALACGVALSPAVFGAAMLQLAWLESLNRDDALLVSKHLRLWQQRTQVWNMLRNSGPLALYAFSEYTGTRFDSLLVALTSSPAVTGTYGAIYGLFQALLAALYAFISVIVPIACSPRDEGRAEATGVFELGALGVVLGMICFLALLSLSPRIVTLVLGRRDPSAALWLRILSISVPLFMFSRANTLRCLGQREFSQAARLVVPAIGCGTVIISVLIPLFGPIGGPVGTVAQEGILVLVTARYLSSRR